MKRSELNLQLDDVVTYVDNSGEVVPVGSVVMALVVDVDAHARHPVLIKPANLLFGHYFTKTGICNVEELGIGRVLSVNGVAIEED